MNFMENFYITSEKARKIFYHRFIKLHFEDASTVYKHSHDIDKLRDFITYKANTPICLRVKGSKILEKRFY